MTNNSGTYNLVTGSDTAPTLTMGLYEDGGVRTIYGASGTWTLHFQNGQPVRMSWEFTGIYADEADASLPTPSFPISTLPPVFGDTGTAVSYLSATPVITQATVTLNNTLTPHEDANNAGVFYRGVVITDRKPTWDMQIESSLVATKDWWGRCVAMTTGSLSLAVGNGSDNVVTVSGGAAQITKKGRRGHQWDPGRWAQRAVQPGDGRRGRFTADRAVINCRRSARRGSALGPGLRSLGDSHATFE